MPPEALEYMTASLAKSTLKQYESALNQWISFCTISQVDVYPEKTSVMKYLVHKYDGGASYNSLNAIRAALSLISMEKIGDDREISRLLRGFYKNRPPIPKYTETWDVDVVLEYLAKIYPLEDLDIDRLTKKVVTLMILGTGQRAQTMSKVRLDCIKQGENGFRIHIIDCIKTSGPKREQPVLEVPFFAERPDICIASTLLRYLDVTKSYRGNIKNLFISMKKPYKAVGAQTISRWIKQVLSESGIDTSKFSAHSTRHASTSKAFEKGVDLEMIRKAAGWSNNSLMFAKVYNRPIVKDKQEFAKAVLCNSKVQSKGK